jgi:hypothetical protein
MDEETITSSLMPWSAGCHTTQGYIEISEEAKRRLIEAM